MTTSTQHELLQRLWLPSRTVVEVGLLGGDLHRTLGAPHHDEDDLRAGRGMRFPMDLGTVSVDGGPPMVFVAHLVATAAGTVGSGARGPSPS